MTIRAGMHEQPLQGLKAVAAEVEAVAAELGVRLRPLSPVDVWKLTRRKHDPLPTYRRRGRGGGRLADRVAVRAWFQRQRLTFASEADGET